MIPFSPQSRFSGPQISVGSPLQYRLRMHVGSGSDPGITWKQQPNEDSLLAVQDTKADSFQVIPFGLFAVADGIRKGGNGQDASRLAVQTLLESVFPRLLSSNNLSDKVLTEIMVHSMCQANRVIYERNLKNTTSMRTTMTAALTIESKAYVVNVGDSRTYHYCPSKGLTQVTRDHSMVAGLVDIGAISPEEVYTHPKRGVIYRCLGKHAQVEIDLLVLDIQAGESLLLCSDGLWEMVRDPEMEQIMSNSALSPTQTSTALIKAALRGGGEDNASAIVVRLTH